MSEKAVELRNLLNKKNELTILDIKKKILVDDDSCLIDLLIEIIISDLNTIKCDIKRSDYRDLNKVFDLLNELIDNTFKFDYLVLTNCLNRTINKIERLIEESKNLKECGKYKKFFTILKENIEKTLFHIEYLDKGLSGKYDTLNFIENLIFSIKNYDYVKNAFEKFPVLLEVMSVDNSFIKRLINCFINSIDLNDAKDVIYFKQIIMFFIKHPSSNFTNDFRNRILNKLYEKLNMLGDNQHFIQEIKDLISNLGGVNISEIEDINTLNYCFRINRAFNINVINSLKNLENFNSKKYIDLRKKHVITIDSPHTMSFEDAISLEKLPNGSYELIIYIIDANNLVGHNKLIDEYAYNLGETIYIPGEPLNMLPHDLSTTLCSLNQNKDSYAIAHAFEVTPKFEIVPNSMKVFNCLINVSNNYFFDDVENMLNNGGDSETLKMFKQLIEISDILRGSNKQKEQYHKVKEIIEAINNEDVPKISYTNFYASKIIEESKVLTNYSIAKEMSINNYPFIYRNNEFKNNDLSALANHNNNLENIISTIDLIYDNSKYSSINKGHHGLGLEVYAHASTPARKYCSLYCQFLEQRFLIDKNFSDEFIEQVNKELPFITSHLNERSVLNEQYITSYGKILRKTG